MPVYKTFFKIAYRSIPSILIYFVLFAALSFMISSSGEQTLNNAFQTESLDITIIDRDHTEASAALSDYLDYYHNLIPLADEDETLQDNLYYNTISYILIIPNGYEAMLKEENFNHLTEHVTIPNTANGVFINNQLLNYFSTLKLYLTSGEPIKTALTKTATACEPENLVETIATADMDANSSEFGHFYFYFRYLAYVLLIIPLNSMTPILTAFKNNKLSQRTKCSSHPLRKQFLELNFACVSYCMILWILFMILAAIVFRNVFFTQMGMLTVLNSLLLIITCTTVTLLVSCFSPKDSLLNIISNLFSLGCSFLCGIFVPMNMLGENVLAVGKFLPIYWYSKAVNILAGFCGEVFSFRSYWICIGVQFAFILSLLSLTLATSKLQQRAES